MPDDTNKPENNTGEPTPEEQEKFQKWMEAKLGSMSKQKQLAKEISEYTIEELEARISIESRNAQSLAITMQMANAVGDISAAMKAQQELEEQILSEIDEAPHGDRSKLLNYFIDNKLKELTESIGDF